MFKCTLVHDDANLLYFKGKGKMCPPDSYFMRLYRTMKSINSRHNILFEPADSDTSDTALIFIGRECIAHDLFEQYGGRCVKPFFWRFNKTDSCKHNIPSIEQLSKHIINRYNLLAPCNRSKRDKQKVELLEYSPMRQKWVCGSNEFCHAIFVDVPSYLGVGSKIYISVNRDEANCFSKNYDYYGKGSCANVTNNDFVKRFAENLGAIYDWFYSTPRTIEEIAEMFKQIEESYIERRHLYYSKGEYNKVRQIFLIEVFKFVNLKSDEQILALPEKMRQSMLILYNKGLVSKEDANTPYRCIECVLSM